jgi:hypothetical protein
MSKQNVDIISHVSERLQGAENPANLHYTHGLSEN